MSGINPYGSQFLNLLGGGNSSAWSLNGQVTSVPNDLKSLAINVILKGQVTANKGDGTTTISTPRGDVGVKFQNPPPVGARVDVQITAGSPPTNAYARPSLVDAVQTQSQPQAQTQTTNTTAQSQGQSSTTPIQNTVATPTATQQTIQNPNIFEEVQSLQTAKQSAAIKTADGTQIPQPPLQVGQAVRLTPLPVAQQSIQALIQNFIAAPQPTVTTTTQTALSTQIVTSSLLSPLPVTPSNTPSPQAQPITVSTPQAQAQQPSPLPILTTNAQSLPTPQPLVTLTPSAPVTIPNTQIVTPPPAPNVQIPIPQAPLTPIAIPQTQVASQTPITTAGDGRIYRIDVQTTQLTPTVQATPSANTQNFPQPIAPQTIAQTPVTAGQISAVATGFVTPQGNPIVQIAPLFANADPQFMVMNYPARDLPVGTRITLTPIAGQATQTISTPSLQSQVGWPMTIPQFFEEGMAMPSLSQTLLTLMPSATQTRQFPVAALMFLAAAKNGDLSGWLGQRPIRAIETAGSENLKKLLQTLSNDMASMATKSVGGGDPAIIQGSTDWRGYLLPLLFGASIDQATLWVKDNGDHTTDDQNNKKKNGTRFVVDVDLSRMGSVQFDGYIQPDKNIFDLAVHTERQFGRDVQQHITGIWTKTLDGMGLSGSMIFKEIKTA